MSEFFPVSSSGHLFISSHLFNLHSAGRLTEVILNFATLLVVFAYFRTEIKALIGALFGVFKGYASPIFHQGLKICVATLPVICIGFLVHHYVDHLTHWGAPLWVGVDCFWFADDGADLYGKHHTTYERITYKKAFLIGLFQAGAFIPGPAGWGFPLQVLAF
ncbi:MAG: undecaprenyl-diphosphate phosphatase [Holosporaceae bacterium]|nr:MAG: undecaprenyl-diphosphate phosphatase [Holosporaceae bacterium]